MLKRYQSCRVGLPQRRACAAGRNVLAILPFAVTLLGGCTGGLLPEEQLGALAKEDPEKISALADADHATTGTVFLEAAGQYAVLDLGAAAAGDEWVAVFAEAPPEGVHAVVAFLDAQDTLLSRDVLLSRGVARVVLREATPRLQLGVTSDAKGPVTLRLTAACKHGAVAPAERTQTVWLNFTGGEGVDVYRYADLAVPSFDAAVLGPAYAAHTALIKQTITATVRAQYAAFNVEISSSDEQPRPTVPHSTVYFGGDHNVLLGLGDSVDRFNERHDDNAIVFVEAFASYAPMGLTPEQMGQMIGHVAAHELGHLMGLHHTQTAAHLMGDDRSAWDLVHGGSFERAPLSSEVFPWGNEDAWRVLAENVGLRPGAAMTQAAGGH